MPRQSTLRYSFQSLVGTAQFEVVSFELKEALSQPFTLTLELISFEHDVDFGHLLDKPVLFTIWDGERPVRYVHGLVSRFSQGEGRVRRLPRRHWGCWRRATGSPSRPSRTIHLARRYRSI